MICYALSCPDGHAFDSWFQSAGAFDALRKAGQVTCPVCGTASVDKALMAPAVRPARNAATPKVPTHPEGAPSAGQAVAGDSHDPARPLSGPRNDIEQALENLRRQVTENSEYVGLNFAAEARAMHDGTTPERAIYGEAKPEEARRLIEDGVPVAPLPFMPPRKLN